MGQGLYTALVFMVMATILMGVSQLAINNIGGQFWNGCGSLITSYQTYNSTTGSYSVDNSKLMTQIPGAATTAPSATNGFFVVDWIGAASKWISGLTNIFTEVASGPYCMLHQIPTDGDISLQNFISMIAAGWYIIILLLIGAFIFGR
jgi:hypothetical protein